MNITIIAFLALYNLALFAASTNNINQYIPNNIKDEIEKKLNDKNSEMTVEQKLMLISTVAVAGALGVFVLAGKKKSQEEVDQKSENNIKNSHQPDNSQKQIPIQVDNQKNAGKDAPAETTAQKIEMQNINNVEKPKDPEHLVDFSEAANDKRFEDKLQDTLNSQLTLRRYYEIIDEILSLMQGSISEPLKEKAEELSQNVKQLYGLLNKYTNGFLRTQSEDKKNVFFTHPLKNFVSDKYFYINGKLDENELQNMLNEVAKIKDKLPKDLHPVIDESIMGFFNNSINCMKRDFYYQSRKILTEKTEYINLYDINEKDFYNNFKEQITKLQGIFDKNKNKLFDENFLKNKTDLIQSLEGNFKIDDNSMIAFIKNFENLAVQGITYGDVLAREIKTGKAFLYKDDEGNVLGEIVQRTDGTSDHDIIENKGKKDREKIIGTIDKDYKNFKKNMKIKANN